MVIRKICFWQVEKGEAMFSIGEEIVYGGMGVCTVTDVGVPDVPGMERTCYVLRPHYVANSKVYAPVEGGRVAMRALLTRAEAQDLIDQMPDLRALPVSKERQEQYGAYRNALKSADSVLLARLIKTLYEKRQRLKEQSKTVPTAEKEVFDSAERLLYGELATALHIPLEDVEPYIGDRLAAAPEVTAAS